MEIAELSMSGIMFSELKPRTFAHLDGLIAENMIPDMLSSAISN